MQDFQARALADELVASIMQLYGEGLERIFAALDDDARDRLAEDGVVASLMLIHGLYPVALEKRVREALDSVRPYMESHGGDVELLGIEDGVAQLRLVGHCKGCPASEATLELAIKKALEETAPDLVGLEVEGVSSRRRRVRAAGDPVQRRARTAWTELEGDRRAAGRTAPMTVAGADLLVANVGGTLLAYRNACGWCRARLDGAPMAAGRRRSPARRASGASSCARAGRSPDDERLQIPPVPLLRGDGRVRVAVGLMDPRRSSPGCGASCAAAGAATAAAARGRPLRAVPDLARRRPQAPARPRGAADRLRVPDLLVDALGRRALPADRLAHAVARAFELSDELWAAFQIPIGLAFFLRSSSTGGDRRPLPEPGRARPSASSTSTRGTGSSPPTPCSRTSSPTPRR